MKTKESKYCNCLYYATNALSRIMTRMADDAFAVTGMSSSYAFLLMTINEQPGINPKELAEIMQLSPSTVTRLVEKLEFRRLIERKQVGRNTEVYPTPEGKAMQSKIKAAWKQLHENYTTALGLEESKLLTTHIFEASQILE